MIMAIVCMIVLWLFDVLMRLLIKDWRIVWVIQLVVFVAMYFLLDW